MGVQELQALARMTERSHVDLVGCNAEERRLRLMSEGEWFTVVHRLAVQHGWATHTDVSQWGDFPNLMLGRGEDVLFVLVLPQIGVVSEPQRTWLERLEGRGCETFVWRPSDEFAVVERLSRGQQSFKFGKARAR